MKVSKMKHFKIMQENQISQSSSCTPDVFVTGQQYNDDSHTAPATPSKILEKRGLV